MKPEPPDTALNELLDLVNSLRKRLRRMKAAQRREGDACFESPDGTSYGLSRARGHVELALEALARKPQMVEIEQIATAEVEDPEKEIERVEGAANDAETHDLDASTWVDGRVDEIRRALSAAFGDEDELFGGLDEAVQSSNNEPQFTGDTAILSIPELVGFFQLQGKTGRLSIEANTETFVLEYLRGELIHAGSSSSPDGERLGEILVRQGHLTEPRLRNFIEHKPSAHRLGEALLRGEVVDEDALESALEAQVQSIFNRLYGVSGCRFTFTEGLAGHPSARVRYNVTRLLLESARREDERQARLGA